MGSIKKQRFIKAVCLFLTVYVCSSLLDKSVLRDAKKEERSVIVEENDEADDSETDNEHFNRELHKESVKWQIKLTDVAKYKEIHGISIYPKVCIVDRPDGQHIKIGPGEFVSEKMVTVYESVKDEDGLVRMTSAIPGEDSWPVQFRKGQIPKEFRVEPYPCYFTPISLSGNFYHIIQDTIIRLHDTLAFTGRLNSLERSQFLSQKPFTGPDQNRTRYESFFLALGIRKDYNVYHAMPHGTCYQHGIFGSVLNGKTNAIDYLTRALEDTIGVPKCPKGIPVTLIQRHTRKILNIDELLQALIKEGFESSQIVTLENMPFAEQWKIMRCTRVLIGVHGAGLQWAQFLKPKSCLLELSYQKLGFLFSEILRGFNGLETASLLATKSYPDWDMISQTFFSNKTLSREFRLSLLARSNMQKYPFLWNVSGFKWFFSRYNPESLALAVSHFTL